MGYFSCSLIRLLISVADSFRSGLFMVSSIPIQYHASKKYFAMSHSDLPLMSLSVVLFAILLNAFLLYCSITSIIDDSNFKEDGFASFNEIEPVDVLILASPKIFAFNSTSPVDKLIFTLVNE